MSRSKAINLCRLMSDAHETINTLDAATDQILCELRDILEDESVSAEIRVKQALKWLDKPRWG